MAARRQTPQTPQLRGEAVVRNILAAAVAELSQKGFAALSIEEVAARAAVAKTTVYRRWPTKGELAVAAMKHVAGDIIRIEDTGSLRGDLMFLLRSFRDFVSSPRGQGLMRMMVVDVANEEISEFARRVREEKSHEPHQIVHRAIARGELPRGTDPTLLFEVIFGAVQHSLCFMHSPIDDRQLETILELVLTGAENGGAIPKRAPAKSGARSRSTRP
ncbi:MAG: TetR/AcrR family transcriptional regulator [Labilithrix sp.]|nr:TetR/AcrR family transcriptional regulator [Labilithrix sp.]MCW5811428.1 TetR/AcrR family transcriptional regulator [Labilithrix sp.]